MVNVRGRNIKGNEMRDINCETIEFKSHVSFLAFGDELWSGARERWQEADEDTRRAVWDRIKEYVESIDEVVDITQINDLIWFECDDLFYPPKFTVKVYKCTFNPDGEDKQELIAEETFEGIGAESEARDYGEKIVLKVVITNDPFQTRTYDDSGIAYIGLVDFLLDPHSLETL